MKKYKKKKLETVNMLDNVTSIGNIAFFECSSLTSITIPDSVTSIGESPFFYCGSLATINYRGTEAEWNAISKDPDWDFDAEYYTINYNYTGK